MNWLELVRLIPPAVIAGFAFVQWRTSRTNLRLGIYQRRFQIYESFLMFYQILTAGEVTEESQYKAIHRKFIAAKQEAKYLFGKNNKIYEYLEKVHIKSFHIKGFHDQALHGTLTNEQKAELHKNVLANLQELQHIHEQIEHLLEKYLDFSEIQ
ncbi:hypothetical protein [Synechococcus elongatus]|uniref:DUF4760 domain-containing protein n=1 Tax=Synechococcus elongatus PCC 11802 TaxID=2283154 RepID=A0AAT9JYG0_SYNEL|nr:hypothetical protein [Synechococcus elongatus]QFZ91381.1 hypothetical protein EKO22_02365 [Synechococcus elongatus PCC 11802]